MNTTIFVLSRRKILSFDHIVARFIFVISNIASIAHTQGNTFKNEKQIYVSFFVFNVYRYQRNSIKLTLLKTNLFQRGLEHVLSFMPFRYDWTLEFFLINVRALKKLETSV